MGKEAIEGIVAVATLVVTVAIVAVLVSKNSDTGNVLSAGGQALSSALSAAIAPASSGGHPNAGTATELGQVGHTGLVLA